ncbi:MAG: molybdopterin-guanine dinucleotide biosynthesis protein A [Kiloniellales bacterium]|nr:molybdopterin-guanine dinucleotide biosynthesis protein A [Kiloniellales bacterium]
MTHARKLRALALAGSLLLWPAAVHAQNSNGDRHSGYYYPEPETRETYKARGPTLQQANRSLRIGFVTGLTTAMAQRPYAPLFAMFAKGTKADKLIIVAMDDGPLDTLYRARGVLADLTAMARLMPVFAEYGVQDWFTFFDLMKMMGFRQLTISNGRDFAHRVVIE